MQLSQPRQTLVTLDAAALGVGGAGPGLSQVPGPGLPMQRGSPSGWC
jgi:hypothetical protein